MASELGELTIVLDIANLEECLEGLVREIIAWEKHRRGPVRLVLSGEGTGKGQSAAALAAKLAAMFPGIVFLPDGIGNGSLPDLNYWYYLKTRPGTRVKDLINWLDDNVREPA